MNWNMANIHSFIHNFTAGSAFRERSLFRALLFLLAVLTFAMPAVSSPDEAPMLAQSGSGNAFKVGSYVKFGRYPQSGNTPEPIEWLVLENNGSSALLISRYGLDCRPFHNSKNLTISWKNCSLRAWLNNSFYDTAFSASEKQSIKPSHLKTLTNKQYGTAGCDDTEDKVFCLSIEELDTYISSPANRKCHITRYAINRNVYADHSGNGFYWLRSPGKTERDVIFANCDGTVSYTGCDATANRNAVRPAIRISLSGRALPGSASSSSSAKPSVATASSGTHVGPKASDCRKGAYVKFGRYPQNNGNTPEPIEWLVIGNDGKTALLISRYGLDCKPFHHKYMNISWRDCDLRKWLNGEFMDRAFNSEERARIAESAINTADNPEYGTKGCGETRDKVFCLSIEEAWKYFGNVKENYGCTEKWHSDVGNADWWVNRDRACQPTAYAVSHGVWQGKHYWAAETKGKASEWWFDNCWFWLRSPGSSASRAAHVDFNGAVNYNGYGVHRVYYEVRPALRIIL